MIVSGGGFLLPSSRVPGGWLWMKLIPALQGKMFEVGWWGVVRESLQNSLKGDG